METTQQKKGIQLNQAFGAVLMIVLIAVLVIVSLVLFTNLGTAVGSTNSTSTVNETFNPTTAGTAISHATDCNFGNFAVLQVTNRTGFLLNSGNYTVSSTGTIANATGSQVYGNTAWNATYTSTNGGGSCVAAASTITNFSQYPTLIGLVGTIVFLGIVIGVLVSSFVFGGKGGA